MSQISPPSPTLNREDLLRIRQNQHNLPTYQTALVGRTDELRKVKALLTEKRLVTLVGPGGIGKTSLALALASDQGSRFEHGVYFIALSGITSHLFLVSAIAEAIQFSFRDSGDPKIQLLNHLHDLNILLVLDNYEHLLPNTGLLSEILLSTQQAQLLVTSRQRLDLRQEWIFELGGLSYPQDKDAASTEDYSAVDLFVQRAKSARPNFALTQDDLAAVASICQSVDGLPLAIELAASWTRALSCQEIAYQIGKDLDFLAANWVDIPKKHRTIRSVLAQSWDMLDLPARSVLMRLAIFEGAIKLNAAQKIAEASPQVLACLIDQSFLQYHPEGEYKLHPLMQQYAAEHLVESGEFKGIAERHCDYFANFLQQRQAKILGTKQRLALEQIGAEIENIRKAWNWAVQQNKTPQILQSAEALFQFYLLRGYFQDGETCFAQAAQQLGEQLPESDTIGLISQLFLCQGIFLSRMGQYAKAQVLFQQQLPPLEESNASDAVIICLRELANIAYRQSASDDAKRIGLQCLALCQKTGNTAESIKILHTLSNISRETACYEEAYQFAKDALALSDADQFPQLHAKSLQNLGVFCNHQGDFEKARVCYQDALVIFREIADRPGESLALIQLGVTYIHLSHYSQTIRCYEEAIPILREIGDQRTLGRAVCNLGVLFQRLGLAEQAQINLEQALKISRRIGEKRGQCMALSNISHFYFQQGDYARAQTYAQEFLEVAESIADRTAQGYAWTNMGNALSGQRDWPGAISAYRHSIQFRQIIGEDHYVLEPLAGLARVALAQGDLALALEHVEILLASEDSWKKCGELRQMWFICYQVLSAHQDPRADRILAWAHERLQAQAAHIDDPELQRSYLENVLVNQKILSAFLQNNTLQTSPNKATASPSDPGLTRRELEVLQWMAAGHSNQEIANGLFISLSTVKRHITNLHHKLGVQRRTQAVARAQELGLL